MSIELAPKTAAEDVNVKADDAQVDKTESNVPSTVDDALLNSAPLINEKFQDALPLLPGVVRGPDGLLNIKSARATQSGLLVSNATATDPVTGAPAADLPVEAVESVQVHSNPYSTEFGGFTGAVTSVETRSGTNEWK